MTGCYVRGRAAAMSLFALMLGAACADREPTSTEPSVSEQEPATLASTAQKLTAGAATNTGALVAALTRSGAWFQPWLLAVAPYTQVSAGHDHSCAVTSTSRAYCWGDGRSGQIGDGNPYQRWTPRAVAGGILFERVSAGVPYLRGDTGQPGLLLG